MDVDVDADADAETDVVFKDPALLLVCRALNKKLKIESLVKRFFAHSCKKIYNCIYDLFLLHLDL